MAFTDFKTTFLAMALAALRKRATLARLAYTDLSGIMNAAKQGDNVKITYVSKPVVSNASMSNTEPAVLNPTTSTLEFAISQWKQVYFDVSDADAASLTLASMRQVATTYGDTLADYIERYYFGLLSRFVSTVVGTYGTTPFATNTDLVADARKAIAKRDGLTGGMAFLVDPDAAGNLLKLSTFTSASDRGQAGAAAGLTGDLGARLGFRFAESNNIPGVTRGSAGASATATVAIGGTRVPVDAAGSAGVADGELVTIDSNLYAVRKGFSGVSGTIVLNRPLTTGVSNNEAIARQATHANNWALDPAALAVVMRPSVPPQLFSGDGNLQALVDPVTGFSLTLEVKRISHGTRYILSALFDGAVVRQERIQRLVG